jgi:hypothetical protein
MLGGSDMQKTTFVIKGRKVRGSEKARDRRSRKRWMSPMGICEGVRNYKTKCLVC